MRSRDCELCVVRIAKDEGYADRGRFGERTVWLCWGCWRTAGAKAVAAIRPDDGWAAIAPAVPS